jgi:hypothetical protein
MTACCGMKILCPVERNVYVTEYGTASTTILPILFLYLNTVIVTAGTFEP